MPNHPIIQCTNVRVQALADTEFWKPDYQRTNKALDNRMESEPRSEERVSNVAVEKNRIG